jgi:hypothetical protein
MLIGLVGLIGSGKDTVANRMVTHHDFVRDSFAKSLKDAVSNIFGWDRKMLEGDTKESRAWREKPDHFWSEKFNKETTPREILQYFGTEVCRGHMLDTIWVDSCMARYKGNATVISDTRFINEIRTIKKNGGKIILVKRGKLPTKEEMKSNGIHRSEWDWIDESFDHVIDNSGTLEELNDNVDNLINSINRRQGRFTIKEIVDATNDLLRDHR